jgi:hypothetical protein
VRHARVMMNILVIVHHVIKDIESILMGIVADVANIDFFFFFFVLLMNHIYQDIGCLTVFVIVLWIFLILALLFCSFLVKI